MDKRVQALEKIADSAARSNDVAMFGSEVAMILYEHEIISEAEYKILVSA